MRYRFYKLFWVLSGEDYRIIRRCNFNLRQLFGFIGVFVIVIFALCFISTYYAFTQLFNSIYIGIPIGLFFAWMITNLYLLLLYTLSKPVMPQVSNSRAKYFSIGIRVLFLIFIAVIMSKPLETLIFKKELSNDIESYKIEKYADLKQLTVDYYDKEISDFKKIITKVDDRQAEFYMNLIQKKEKAKDEAISSMTTKITNSNYYINSIKILNKNYPETWGFTLLIVLLFLTPSVAKAIVASESDFNREKSKIHRDLVLRDYSHFKQRYTQLLSHFSKLPYVNINYTEKFVDPPFNTILKINKIKLHTSDDLKAHIYNG